MTDSGQRQKAIDHLRELIADISVAMLTTGAADRSLHSRPMVNINSNFQGELWLFTHRDDPKVEEIRANPQVNVAFADPDENCYVSITGQATTVEDTKRQELMWTKACEPWFPEGPDSDKLALIKIDVEQAEYWDGSKNSMIALTGFLKAFQGDKQAVKHEKLDWDESGASQVPPSSS